MSLVVQICYFSPQRTQRNKLLLLEAEVYFQMDFDLDRFAVFRCRLKGPLPNGVDGALVQRWIERLRYADVLDLAIGADHQRKLHDAFMLGLLGIYWV